MKYDPKEIEAKWQAFWEKNKTFGVTEDQEKEKFYGLIEFPYPSGAGLHVGHPRSYTAMDVITRQKRMEGKNVLFPIGFDSFGLPTENFAIKTGRPPQEITDENIATFTRQLKSLGFGFDWDRAVTTSEPEYYKWTQWIFLQLYKHGLAYKANQPINWCPKDKIGLANEEVVDGACERCGTPVEKRNKEQWMLAITKYADTLLEGLNEVDYITRAKVQQENWIGRSEGAEITFKLNVPGQEAGKHNVTVFTTRPDTIFGATFLAISAELAQKWLEVGWDASDDVKKYIKETLQGRTTAVVREEMEKTGVDSGVAAVNPASGEEIPVWIVNYVMGDYGTGAIMAVPAHDERDWEFAQKVGLLIKEVVQGGSVNDSAFTENGIAVNSDFLNGLQTPEAKEKIIKFLEEKGIGKRQINYKLRDWVFSRQRYWGEPIPLVFCEACKNKKYNFILIHGYTSNSQRGFKPWLKAELEKQGHAVWNPDLPNTDTPDVNEQAQYILDNTPFSIDDNTILIGHSLGGVVVYRLLEKINQKIAKAVFVDPVYKPDYNDKPRPAVEKSCDWIFDWKKIHDQAKDCLVLGDNGFGIIKKEHLEELSKILDCRLSLVTPSQPHFSSDNGNVTQEPAVLEACLNSGWIPLPEDELPLKLPNVAKYLPTDTGESPLAPISEWVNTICPQCGGPARRETDTMPNWAGSSWYFLRYCDPKNANNFFAETDFRFKSEISVTEKDTHYIEAFKKIYTDLDAEGVPIFAANRLLLNGLNGRLWLPLKTVSVMYWDRDTDKVFAYLKEQGYQLTVENKGGHLFERDGVRVEMIPVFEENGKFLSYSAAGVEQPMNIEDLQRHESAHLQGFWYRTVSPEYNLRHLEFVRDHESAGREKERDEEKIEFLQSYLKNVNPKIRYFMPVDWYNGGMEHTVLHLLYSRFWNQFLYDIGVVPTREPYKKRTSHGMILASDGQKMSKSLGNVINPDEIVQEYGADALRTYIMFMGPFDQAVSWDTNGLIGVRRFLERVWNLQEKVSDKATTNSTIQSLVHRTIKKITEDIEGMRFNTAVAKLMELANEMGKEEKIAREHYQVFIQLLSVFAPHIGEELWSLCGGQGSVAYAEWPQYDPELAKEAEVTVVVQVNGKLRDQFVVSPEISEEEMKQMALSSEKVTRWFERKEPKKVIYVKGKLVSIVV